MAYSLQLTGNTLPGHDLEKAKADFAKLFNVDDNKKLEKIFSVKKNVTIKKRMTQSDAIHYQEQLNKIGLESVILEPDGTPFVIDEQINSNTSIPNSENQEKNSISNETSSTDYDNEDLEDSVNYASSHQASNGLIWLKEGFNFFKQNPIKWIFALIVWWIAIAIVNIVPVIGQIISLLLSMAMLPGLMYGAYQQDNGNELSIGDTFMAIKKSLSLLVLYIISSVIFVGFGFFNYDFYRCIRNQWGFTHANSFLYFYIYFYNGFFIFRPSCGIE